MGSREEHLDALLAAVVPGPPAPPEGSSGQDGPAAATSFDRLVAPVDPQLAPLLEVADDLARIAAMRPDPAFAERLGQRILARAEQRRREGIGQVRGDMSILATATGGAQQVRLLDSAQPVHQGRAAPGRVSVGGIAVRRVLIAAVALVALGIGAWTVTAVNGAAPGSVFFGLRQMGQTIGLTFMDQNGRVRAHIQAARQWLADLKADASGHGNSGAYRATLGVLLDENDAAAQAIQQMPPGSSRDELSGDLAKLRGDERSAFREALSHIGWPDRLATTQALDQLGDAVPLVASATVTQGHGLWQVTLVGSGFEPGAVLLIDGNALGTVTNLSPTSLIAEAPSGSLKSGSVTIGVGNPDGTAAATTVIYEVAAPTATPNGNSGNGPHGSPTHTPGPNGNGKNGSNVPSGQ